MREINELIEKKQNYYAKYLAMATDVNNFKLIFLKFTINFYFECEY